MRTILAVVLCVGWAVSGFTQVIPAEKFLLTTGPCTIHSGSGAPSTSLGAVCDVYHQTNSPYVVYVKTGVSTWTAVVQMPSSAAAGDLIAAASATVSARIAAVAAGQVLASNGVSAVPVYTASPSLTGITGAANLTINPTGNVILNPTGNNILPTTNYDINIGMITLKYLTLHAAELWVETLVAQNTIATIGGRILVGPTTTLVSDLTSGATSIVVKHNQMVSGDRIVMQEDGALEWMAITGAPSGGGPFTYPVTRNLDGTGVNNWPAGAAVFNTGTTGDGYIDIYSINGLLPGSTAGPTIVGNVRTGTTYSDIAARWAIGNLNGVYGYGADTYGVAFGDFTNSYLTVDATNGIRMIGDAGTMLSMDTAGNATFAGRLTVGTNLNTLANTEFIRGRGTGDRYSSYWGGSSATSTVDPSAAYSCAHASGSYAFCSNRATHGTGWSWIGFDQQTSISGNVNPNGASFGWAPLGSNSVVFDHNGGTPSNGQYGRMWGPVVAVDEDQLYEYSAYISTGGSFNVRARIVWYGVDGGDGGDQPDYITEADGATTCNGGTTGLDIGTWCRVSGIFDPPAGARLAALTIISFYDGGDANPITIITRPFFGEARVGQTQLTPWGPGGQTLISGDMLSTDLVIANTLRSSGATALATGTGFWLDATGTPTFRVGNPSGDRFEFNGTNTIFSSSNFSVSTSGVAIAPGTSSSYSSATAYGYSASNGSLGTFGWDSSGVARSIQLTSSWTGGDGRSAETGLTSNYAGTGTVAASSVSASASNNSAVVTLTTSQNSVLGAGRVVLYGYPDFQNDATTTAGALCGYIVAVYQQDTTNSIRIPFYAANGGSCPTVP